MINLKDIKSAKHISDPTEEKLNNLKLVSQETNKEIVSTQGENTKDILRARSIERLDALNVGSETFDNKIGERETSVAEELTEITDRTEKVISDSEKYTEDIEAFLSVAKGDDFLFFLDGCTRAVGRLDKLANGSYLCYGKKITSWDIPLPSLTSGDHAFAGSKITKWNIELPSLKYAQWAFYSNTLLNSFIYELPSVTNADYMFENCHALTSIDISFPALKTTLGTFKNCTNLESFKGNLPLLTNGGNLFQQCYKLENFSCNLPELLSASGMFNGCRLNLNSIKNIAKGINDLAAKDKTGNITIGMQLSLKYDNTLTDEEQPEAAAAREALSIISSKGWTIVEQYNS